MLFNTLQFFVFFALVYALYVMFDHKRQNRMLLVASYIFYGSWDWRFLFLILFSTALNYVCGIKICAINEPAKRKLLICLCVIGNLSVLGFFKYFNFFISSLGTLLSFFGFPPQTHFFNIILPVGISFYTFQAMSYPIDIYRKKLTPTKNFFDFALFIAYFPQLVAGPIERARHLLPQILAPRRVTLDKFYEGAYLIFWGLFIKVFTADNLAGIVDPVFNSPAPYNGAAVLVAVYAFAFQIFCDFAGYSTIARGLGKCMGFDIMLNFNLPYFATNPREFWQRWHISLSTWLKDYLYIPLGGNRKSTLVTYRNLAITMLLGGLWHGAAWTFVIWGAYHGFLLIIHRIMIPWLKTIKQPQNVFAARIWFFMRIVFFFHLACFGWMIFRAQSMNQVQQMLEGIIHNFNLFAPGLSSISRKLIFFTWILILVQVWQFIKKDLLFIMKCNFAIRTLFYLACFFLLALFGVTSAKEFIYFQF